MSAPSSHLVVIDAANCLYRAFFALPPLRNAEGFPTNAVLGFVTMLRKVIREESPDHLVVVFDPPGGKSFRQDLYSDYKAQRDKQPEDLSAQIPAVHEIIDAYGLPVLQVDGFEADDVIATLAIHAPDGFRVTILSTDKDLMQLVDERVTLLDTMKDRRYDASAVEERFGVPPEKVLDLRALVGDPSDNIPGVKGIGEKGAAKLIKEWGDLETLLANRVDVKPTRAKNALESHADDAVLSKTLATLRTDVELPIDYPALALRDPDNDILREIFARLEFTRLIDDLGASNAAESSSPKATHDAVVCTESAALAKAVAEIPAHETMMLAPFGGALRPLHDAPAGLAIAIDANQALYLPLCHDDPKTTTISLEPVLEVLGARLREGRWGGRATKALAVFFGEAGLAPAGPAFDVDLAAFVVDPAAVRGTSALATQYLGQKLAPIEELTGRGAKAIAPSALEVSAAATWAAEEVCAIRALMPLLEDKLASDDSLALYRDIELPLSGVLAEMERNGVRVDEAALRALSKEYERELETIEADVHRLAGETFAINSPKQLQQILFEKLKLPVVRKTKTGYSTDEGVLEQLSSQHPLPERVLAFRRLTKLKSTYVDALPPLVHPKSGRIHPSFHQTGAATGRLSASNPNVQNIPIRTEQGLRIREAFIPRDGFSMVSADYSQVELRILAHFSADESLLEAFRSGDDIHRRTAAAVLGKAPEDVDSDERARAKAINFGIIYGSTAFGIANQLGIASAEAQATIDAYFSRYSGVRRFLDETVTEAKVRGFVSTLFGRRRYLPDLASRNRVLRGAAERMAVNTVIQGTAADLIKRAMVGVSRALKDAALGAEMILQVHDELVFETPPDTVDRLEALLRREMEGAGELAVPLEVEIGVGHNWREAH